MAQNAIATNDIAWRPDDAARARARLGSFIRFCGLDSCEALYQRSINDVAWFTTQVLKYFDIQFDRPYQQILDLSNGIPWARWCVGAGLNITRSCLLQPCCLWYGRGRRGNREH